MRHSTKSEVAKLLVERMSKHLQNIDYPILAADISDIYYAVKDYVLLVDSSLKNTTSEQWFDSIAEIETELEHIVWHYKSLKKIIKSYYKKYK